MPFSSIIGGTQTIPSNSFFLEISSKSSCTLLGIHSLSFAIDGSLRMQHGVNIGELSDAMMSVIVLKVP
jgi:hypothetical protein